MIIKYLVFNKHLPHILHDVETDKVIFEDFEHPKIHEYFKYHGVFCKFIQDCCELRANAWVSAGDLRAAYETWCEETGEVIPWTRRFIPFLRNKYGCANRDGRGYPLKRNGKRMWKGIEVKSLNPTD